jgi:hypothetical protein
LTGTIMVNPSCNIPAREKGLAFPTVGDGPWRHDRVEQIMQELEASVPAEDRSLLSWQSETRECEVYREGSKPWQMARAGVYVPGMVEPEDVEIVALTRVRAVLYGWKFTRRPRPTSSTSSGVRKYALTASPEATSRSATSVPTTSTPCAGSRR